MDKKSGFLASFIKGFGRCIYCGDINKPRTREHIIPYSLGGNWVIQDASCDDCANVTKLVEQRCSRGIYRPVRAHLGLPTRRKKEFPKKLPLTFLLRDSEIKVDLPIKEHPHYFLTFDIVKPPLFLTGETSDIFYVRAVAIGYQADYSQRASSLPVQTIAHDAAVDYLGVCSLIAKIAHAFAIVECGIDSFDPLLLDIIYGKPVPFSRYIGGGYALGQITAMPDMHRCRIIEKNIDGVIYFLCDVQLFSIFGAPIYQVVVGRKR